MCEKPDLEANLRGVWKFTPAGLFIFCFTLGDWHVAGLVFEYKLLPIVHPKNPGRACLVECGLKIDLLAFNTEELQKLFQVFPDLKILQVRHDFNSLLHKLFTLLLINQ